MSHESNSPFCRGSDPEPVIARVREHRLQRRPVRRRTYLVSLCAAAVCLSLHPWVRTALAEKHVHGYMAYGYIDESPETTNSQKSIFSRGLSYGKPVQHVRVDLRQD